MASLVVLPGRELHLVNLANTGVIYLSVTDVRWLTRTRIAGEKPAPVGTYTHIAAWQQLDGASRSNGLNNLHKATISCDDICTSFRK